MVLVPEVVDAVGPDVPVLAAGGIGTGRQMAAALALGAQGVWTGLDVADRRRGRHEPGGAGEHARRRPRATPCGRARHDRQAGPAAAHARGPRRGRREDSPGPLPMPLQGILYDDAARRVSRVQRKELSGFPVGQIVGRLNKVRPTKDVIFEMVEEWIETTQRLNNLIEA